MTEPVQDGLREKDSLSDTGLRSDEQWGGVVSQEPDDPRPILWTVGSAFDRRADMLWENRPCRDAEQVIAFVRDGLNRGATEIKVRDFTFRPAWQDAINDQVLIEHNDKLMTVAEARQEGDKP